MPLVQYKYSLFNWGSLDMFSGAVFVSLSIFACVCAMLSSSYERVKIPEWASGEPLRKILDSQSGGPNLHDPEDIFPEFSTSIPDNIFDEEPIRDRRGSRCEREVSE